MSLPDLATLDDLEDRLAITLTPDQQRIATRQLHDASARIRQYTGQKLTQVVDDVALVRIRNGKVRLPQKPVTAISGVLGRAFDGTQVPVYFWWEGTQVLRVYPQVPNSFAFEPFVTELNWVAVTYTHGYTADEMPDSIVGIAVQVVGRALGSDLMDSGKQQEAIAGYSYTLGAAAAAGGFGLLPSEKEVLDDFKMQASSVVIGP